MMMGGNNTGTTSSLSAPSPPASAPAPSLARPSSSSSSSVAAANSTVQLLAEDALFHNHATDLTFTLDSKLQTERALMEDLMASLRHEEKLLDADAWKYAAPRSQPHLTSMSGVKMAKQESVKITAYPRHVPVRPEGYVFLR